MSNSNTDQLTGPYARGAALYLARGWLGAQPVVGKSGNLPNPKTGLTGHTYGLRWPSDAERAEWLAQRGGDNLMVRLPETVVAIDVDCWGGKRGQATLDRLTVELGDLPPTYACTARTDGSRRLFYRVPAGRHWTDVGGDVDTLWWGHRFAVVWPSVHPETGTVNTWFDPAGTPLDGPPSIDALTDMPGDWIDRYSWPAEAPRSRQRSTADGSGRADRWLDPTTGDKVDQEAICLGEYEPYGTQRDALIALVRSGWAYNVPAVALEAMCTVAVGNFPQTKPEPWTQRDVQQLVASCTEVPAGKSTEFAGDVVTPEMLALARRFCGVEDDSPTAEAFDAQVNQAAAQHVVRALGRRFGDEKLRQLTTVDVDTTDRRADGGSILDEPEAIPAVWGDGDQVLWASGESTMIVAHQGVGKTTIAQQAVLHRIGVRSGSFLGLPIKPATGRVLYLMMDRPHQARRSFRRMISESDRALLAERLVVWSGPLPVDPLSGKDALADLVYELCPDVEDVVVDSVKDLAPGVSKDEVGSALNLAWQELIQRGTNLLLLHHERKAGQESKRHHNLDDVYGSTWLTSGQGSVLVLDGEPGDVNVELRQLKAPADMLTLSLRHDHAVGRTTLYEGPVNVQEALTQVGDVGATVEELALAVRGKTAEADIKYVRRELKKLGELARCVAGTSRGGSGGRQPDRWFRSAQAAFVDGLEV